MARASSPLFLGAFAVAVGLVVLTTAPSALAADPDPLQDICVADLGPQNRVRRQQVDAAQVGVVKASYGRNGSSGGNGSTGGTGTVKVNGFACIEVPTADDFFSDIFAGGGMETRATGLGVGSVVTEANVTVVPGLNTQGISLARTEFAPSGVNPPHTHPRASEIIFVLAGTLDVAFITTANVLFAKTIAAGEMYVFPRGLVHYQNNSGNAPAVAISAFNSQLPGTQFIPVTLFGATPEVPTDVLAKSFLITAAEVDTVKASFGTGEI